MILLDGPYISEFLLETLARNRFPVIATEYARAVSGSYPISLVEESEAIRRLERNGGERLYTPSENSISWISRHLENTGLPEKISMFKNKSRFREMIRRLYPDFRFRTVDADILLQMSVSDIFLPCVIKPATGFFSLGVYPVFTESHFVEMQKNLRSVLENIGHLYPESVLNTQTFIVEEYVPGEEFAIDAYFDGAGNPAILGILRHMFSSEKDVRDRVYTTSPQIIEDNLAPFYEFLQRIGILAGVKNFAMHVELRRRPDGKLVPIEINPMRFGGWCTTADLAHHAWGTNPYEQFFLDCKPDWAAIISESSGSLYSLVVLDNTTGIAGPDIRAFDYDAVLENFEKPIKLQKIDFREYPLFGFLFVETDPDNRSELERILHNDLRSYVDSV